LTVLRGSDIINNVSGIPQHSFPSEYGKISLGVFKISFSRPLWVMLTKKQERDILVNVLAKGHTDLNNWIAEGSFF
jgi:hypothetical protein